MSFDTGTMMTYSVVCIIVNLPLYHALCKAGEFLSPSGYCEPCRRSSFMKETNHNNTSCLQCTEDAPKSAELWHPCNATHNAVYRCVNDTFNVNGNDILCQQCHKCLYPGGKPCRHDQDTVCCSKESLTVVSVKSNENCKHKTKNDKYCCIESEQTTVEGNTLSEVTRTEIPEMQEQNTSSENKSMPNINIDNNGELSTGVKAGIIAGSIAGFIVIAIIIGAIYLFRRRKSNPVNYHSTASFKADVKEEEPL